MLYSNIVYVVIGNLTEYTAHMAHHAVLSAIVNLVVTDDMGSDFFLAPANLQRAEYGLHLVLIAACHFLLLLFTPRLGLCGRKYQEGCCIHHFP